uniref:Uncharacterized protein n=1 Tax=Oryza glaberrima TaxID=4538 RepID=I1NZQ8_ORYGL
MAGEHRFYDSNGDVSRYMLDDMEFLPLFGEAEAATTLPLPVLPDVEPLPTAPAPAATAHVEPAPAADFGLGNPVLADLGFDVDLDFFPELNFHSPPPPPAMNAGGYTPQVQASPPVMHHQQQQQQPLAPLPAAHGFAGQPAPATTMAPSGGDDGLFLAAPSRDAPCSPVMFNFMDFNVDMGDVDMDDVLMWADQDTHGAAAGGDTAPPVVVDEYADFVPFQAGDLDCSNCHLVREMMHANASRTIYFLVHATGVGSFQHAIVDRRYTATGAEGLHFPGRQLLYFDLTNHTIESASDFIASNVEKLKNDTTGHHFLDTGYNFSGAVRTDMANSHTAMEMNMLHTIVSAPFENVTTDAASPPAAQFIGAPPAAELPAPVPAPAPPAAHEQNAVVATLLFKVEEFYAAANSRPAAKRADVKILESSQVTQQAGGSSAATATMYPSMVDRKRKRAQATPSRMAPHEVIQYLRATAVETDKELETLNNFFKVCDGEDKALITFSVEQVRMCMENDHLHASSC